MKPKENGSRPLNNPYDDIRVARNDRKCLEEADVGQRCRCGCPSVTQLAHLGKQMGIRYD